MRCYVHQQTDAVGQCTVCGKFGCHNCLQPVEGQGPVCQSCVQAEVRREIESSQRRVVSVWVFTGIVTAISLFVAFGSISQAGAAALLIPVGAFAASWCLFWGWLPTWRGFRNIAGGWGCYGSWLFLLIVICVTAEILVGVALLIGAFTGIQKYLEDQKVIVNGKQMLDEMSIAAQ